MKKVSLKEVANRLGVSIALVSYVANNPSKTFHNINIPATLVVKESCGEKLISTP